MAIATPVSAAPDRSRTYTAAELFAFPPHWRYELVCGKLREKMPTGDAHGALTFALSLAIGGFVQERGLGRCWAAETGFLVSRDPDTVLAPDFAFLGTQRLPKETLRGFVRAVPDLVLETRSPSDRSSGVATKIQEWLDAGVSMALDLDPQRRVLTVYRPGQPTRTLGPDDIFDGADVLPGFTLPLSRLFS